MTKLNFILALAFVAAAAAFGVSRVQANTASMNDHGCDAPCTVNFDGRMAEDNFNIDYQASAGNVGKVVVFREMPCDHFCFEVHMQRNTCPAEQVTLTDPGDAWPAGRCD